MPRRKINVTQKILQALRKNGPMSWGNLRKYLGVSKAGLSENLSPLVEQGLVKTEIDDERRPPRTIYALHETESANVEIPDTAIDEIKQHIKNNPELGYTNYRDYIHDAVVEKLMREERKTKRI